MLKPGMISRTILVADDDALLRESLCDLLADLGATPRAVGNAGRAIEVLSHTRCDLVLSDVDMPDMTGFALLGWIQAHQQVPAVLMSARADQRMDLEAHRAGAVALLSKPVAAGSIAALIHRLFDQRT